MVRIIVSLALMLLPSAAHAETRIALLIGNRGYDPSVGVLKNPAVVGDALATDQGREAKRHSRWSPRPRLNAEGSGAKGFIYYSGHGAAENDTNINYFIPVDAKEPGTSFGMKALSLTRCCGC